MRFEKSPITTLCVILGFGPVISSAALVDLYLLGGQSNMNGVGKASELPKGVSQAVPHAYFQFGAEWMSLDLEKVRVAHRKGEFGPEFSFARELAAESRPVYISKYAASGMPLDQGWNGGKWIDEEPAPRRRTFYPGERSDDPNMGQLYRGMLRKFQVGIDQLKRAGHTPVVRGFIWMQGEQDAKHPVSAERYAESLERLRRRLSEDLEVEGLLPFVFGQVLPHEPTPERFTHRDEIREQMRRAGLELSLAKMVSTDGIPLRSDLVHYSTEGQLELGRAFALALKPWIPEVAITDREESETTPDIYEKEITSIPAFLEVHCSECHNAEKKKGGINVAAFTDFQLANATHWQELIDNLQRGDMPPEDALQPSDANRRLFLSEVRSRLDRVYADSGKRDFRFTRLTNRQIAWSLRDLLGIDRDFSGDLIEDPVGKHGESLQSELEFTPGHMELYLGVLQQAVKLAVPDLADPPTPYVLHGNDWEKQHYLNRNDLAHGQRRKHRRYRGPEWLKDDFKVPLPPNHFFRIYIDDNRQEGAFRVRVYLRNRPPQEGGALQPHEFSVFFDKGFKSPMHTIDSFTLEAKPGVQVFEVFGNVYDYPGVDPGPLMDGEAPYGVTAHFKYRFLTIQNCSPLHSAADQPVTNKDWVINGDGHFVRADDIWMNAWGEEFGKINWLKPSHGGSNHDSRGKPAVFREVMKDTSYAVIERIEFDMPWQWPPASVQPYLEEGTLSDRAIAAGIKRFAPRAWRRPLTRAEDQELDALIQKKLSVNASRMDALRDLLAAVLADTRFLFYTDVESSERRQNFELVSRLAGFLWQSVPDNLLSELASRDESISDGQLSAAVERMIADSRSARFVEGFTADWVGFSKIDQIAINPNYHRNWNPKFKDYMKEESVAFMSTLLYDDLSCLNLLASDFVVANDVMAKFYGLPGPESGHRYSRVPAPEGRGGVLTQAAFLLAYGDGEDAHAVNRGVWVRSRLLGDPPRDPPPEVPALAEVEERSPGASALSTKGRLAAHRVGVCYDCHQDIDPWGVAMERYGATGMPRERILRLTPGDKVSRRLHAVADEAQIRGKTVKGMQELQSLLREQHRDDFAHGFSEALFSYALGRPLDYHEDAAVASLAHVFKKGDFRLAELIEAIVLRPEFKHPNGGSLP